MVAENNFNETCIAGRTMAASFKFRGRSWEKAAHCHFTIGQ